MKYKSTFRPARQQHGVEVAPLIACVTGIDRHAARRKAGRDVLEDVPDQLAMLAGAKGDFLAWRNFNRNAVLFTLLRVLGNQRFTLGQISGEARSQLGR